MAGKIQCATHGESEETFVCAHPLRDSTGLGFNCAEPTSDKPFPDAWCDDCELIRAAHNGWDEESEKLVKISLLCSACYERARIRNTRTSITLDDLAELRWKCVSCEEWHTGPCLDFGYDSPLKMYAHIQEPGNPSSKIGRNKQIIHSLANFARASLPKE